MTRSVTLAPHGTKVEYVPYHGGYPFRATCWCGWKSKTYASFGAATLIAEDHMEHPTDRNRTVLYTEGAQL